MFLELTTDGDLLVAIAADQIVSVRLCEAVKDKDRTAVTTVCGSSFMVQEPYGDVMRFLEEFVGRDVRCINPVADAKGHNVE